MSFAAWMVIGLIAGWQARLIGRGSGYGLAGDILAAEVGALAGGFFIAGLLNIPDPLMGFNLVTILASFVGSHSGLLLLRRLGSGNRYTG
jgi:uncharacterized membrane protein YeaQ/YmgE (transglycosylase-associated protein family)